MHNYFTVLFLKISFNLFQPLAARATINSCVHTIIERKEKGKIGMAEMILYFGPGLLPVFVYVGPFCSQSGEVELAAKTTVLFAKTFLF